MALFGERKKLGLIPILSSSLSVYSIPLLLAAFYSFVGTRTSYKGAIVQNVLRKGVVASKTACTGRESAERGGEGEEVIF